MYEPKHIVTSESEIRTVIPGTFERQVHKVIDHVDDNVRVWIERSPFLTMATVSADGAVDVSPKGDPAGFVKVLDRQTLAIPDRPGNHRFDSFLNILETGHIGLMFMVPNRREVVRVNGTAQIVRDEDLRSQLAVEGKVPDFVVIVHVAEAFYHCGKAVIRSGLWEPEKAVSTDGLPTYGFALKAHGSLETPLEEIERLTQNNEKNRLYDE
ncbi:pyridoxamine 5'-phosphate oxidase family protein [Jannaschia sp. KMU-145]|uniref:pyridoxamine 5'-phosphate oxidase family protein n=1 Tax=Jannaschia halovivens TaxID=3388667 RepID=UPI00396AF467